MPDISLIKSSVIYSLCIFFVVFIKLHSTNKGRKGDNLYFYFSNKAVVKSGGRFCLRKNDEKTGHLVI